MNKNANLLTDDRYKEHVEFWKKSLSLYEENFRFIQTGEKTERSDKKSHNHRFGESSQALLKQLSGGDALGEFVLIATGFHFLLQQYTDGLFSAINTPLLSKNDLGKSLTSIVPLLSGRGKKLSIREFIKDTQNNISLAYSYQNFPVEDIFEVIHQKSVIYNSNVLLRNSQIHVFKDDEVFHNHDLVFDLNQNDQETTLTIHYREGLYFESFIGRIGDHLENFIGYFNDLSEPVGGIDILSKNEKDRLLNRFSVKDNSTEPGTVPQLFTDQVKKTPDLPAVKFKNIVLTYRELDEKTDALASYLRNEYQIRNEEVVGVLLPKSELSVIAKMAILKAGACYLPLHEDSPPERLRDFCDQANVKVILTHSELLPKVQKLYSIPMFVMDIQLGGLENQSFSLSEELSDAHLAYIIFTSGSTGVPKGVMVEHKSIVNIATDYIKEFKVTPEDRYLQLLSLAFDGSVLDILTALLSGAQLILPHKEVLADPTLLASFVEKHQVTMTVTTASFLGSLEQLPLESLRLIVSAGEPARVEDALFYARTKKFYNAYGPTECTVDTTLYQVDPAAHYSKIPIGLPRRNYNIYLLGHDQKLLPEGIKGEICVTGVGVARGYLKEEDPEKSAFIENPFIPGEKMYKTGDLGYWNADGFLEYVERRDEQIKIRGYRVDINEVEHEIRKQVEVADTVVVAKEDPEGNLYLVAYLTEGRKLDQDQIKSSLRERLPDYMVPRSFVVVSEIPLTPNGKVDTDSLPEVSDSLNEKTFLPPRNRVEEKLVGIWKKLFDLQEVSIRDNFFELGGHSLNSIKFISEISDEFNCRIDTVGIFKHPTIEELAVYIQQAGGQNTDIVPLEEAAHYTLSNGQRRLWALHQFSKDQFAYNIPNSFALHGLDVGLFKIAYGMLIERHEILRTVFNVIEGEPRQVIEAFDQENHGIGFVDIRDQDDKEILVKKFSREMATIRFDLSESPLIKGKLVRASENDYLFFLTMHHIIGDGWSQGLIIKEMRILYDALVENKANPLPPLSFQYKDFAAWQHQNLQQEQAGSHRDFWKENLSGTLPVLNLPTDFPRPQIMTQNGGLHYFSLSKNVADSLEVFSKDREVSLFVTLFAAVKALMFKYTDDTDMILGMSTSGRNDPALEGQVGFYVNLLPVRTTFDKEDNFETLLETVRENVYNALEHEAYPFDEIVSEVDPERDTSRSPLFDVLVELLNVDTGLDALSEIGGKSFGSADTDFTISKYDLTIKFKEIDGIRVYIEYNADLFEKSSIHKVEEHLKKLLEEILHNPGAKLGDINILSEKESGSLRQFARGPEMSFPKKSIIELFEKQAEKLPDSTALIFEGQAITYKALDEMAESLACELIDQNNLRPGDVVAIVAERSVNVIAGMLAIWKAGAIFLPVEPAYPTGRIIQIMKDAGAKLVLTNADEVLRLSGSYNCQWYALDIQMPLLEKREREKSDITDLEQVAYMIYTSGSTGSPKGVKVSHKSIANYTLWANQFYFDKKAQFCFPLFTSLSFDLTLTSICCTLSTGNSLFISDNQELGELLKDIFVNRNEITAVKLTPSLIDVLEHLPIGKTHIRTVIAGGEIFSKKHYNILKKLNQDIRIFNEYGPTEATVGCIVNEIINPEGLKYIGRPIANVRVYILDDNLGLKPSGSVGEIALGGSCLAEGYHNLTEQTAVKFIQDPYGEPGERLYLSGDLGKWSLDGEIEFLGRKDEQLKIRGFRIEPKEIENSLMSLEGINQVAVLGETQVKNDVRLVCYYTSERQFEVQELRMHLESSLPKFMIPDSFVSIEKMPLSSNGKIDKKSLLAISKVEENSSEDFEEPENDLQNHLLDLWKEVLGKEKISINDNFFDMGGDSLKVIELNAKINAHYPDVVEVYNIFSNATPKKLEGFMSKSLDTDKPKIKKIQKIEL